MPAGWKNYRRMRKGRKGKKRRSGYKSSGSKQANKIYKYVANLDDQYIVSNTGGTAGAFSINGGSAPLQQSATVGWSGGMTTPTPSVTALNNTYDFGAGIPFRLGNLANGGALTALYDSYRIREIQCTVELMSGSALLGSYQVNPTVYAVVDADDADAPTAQVKVTGRPNHKVMTFNNKNRTKYTIKIKPSLATTVFQSQGTSGALDVGFAQSSSKQWLDCNFPLIEQYGLKLWFSDVYLGGTNANVTIFRLQWRYVLEFKAPLTLC